MVSGLAIPGAGERASDPVIDEPEVVMGHPKMSGWVGTSTLIHSQLASSAAATTPPPNS